MDNLSIKNQHNQTLAKALLVLEAFDIEHPDWGIRELSRELKINPATIHRFVSTYCDMGYLEQDPATKRYHLGPKIVKMARLYAHHNPLPDIALKVFERFADRFSHAFYLIALTQRFAAVYLAIHQGSAPIKIVVEPGGSTALHSTAAGKILLAHQDSDYLDEYLQLNELQSFTPRTITEPEELRQEIEQVRQQGFAVNDGEQYEDVGAVAVPIIEKNGNTTSVVSLAYPHHFLKDGRLDLDNVIAIAHDIANEVMLRAYGLVPQSKQQTTSVGQRTA